MCTETVDTHGNQNTTDEKREHYLNTSYTVKSWFLTINHKRIAILYLGSVDI